MATRREQPRRARRAPGAWSAARRLARRGCGGGRTLARLPRTRHQALPTRTGPCRPALRWGLGQQPGCRGPDNLADPQRVGLGFAAPGLLAVALRDQKVTAHIREGDVVLGVVRPLPHIQRPGGVEYLLPGQVRADAPRHWLDVASCGDHGRVVVHGGLLRLRVGDGGRGAGGLGGGGGGSAGGGIGGGGGGGGGWGVGAWAVNPRTAQLMSTP